MRLEPFPYRVAMARRRVAVVGLLAAAVGVTLVLTTVSSYSLLGPAKPWLTSQLRTPPRHTEPVESLYGSGDESLPHWVMVAATVFLLLYALSLLVLLVLHRRGRLGTEAALTAAPDDPDAANWGSLLGAELAAATQEQLGEIALGTARDAIIACWLRLHTATRRAGLPPSSSETPQEFTARAMRSLRLDNAAITELSELYREARFSEHAMGEAQRRQAAAALSVLAAQLAADTVPV